jgi:hypothetical protein
VRVGTACRAEFPPRRLRPASLRRRFVADDVRGQGLGLLTWPVRCVLVPRAPARRRAAEALASPLVETAVVLARDDQRSFGDARAGTTLVEAPRR